MFQNQNDALWEGKEKEFCKEEKYLEKKKKKFKVKENYGNQEEKREERERKIGPRTKWTHILSLCGDGSVWSLIMCIHLHCGHRAPKYNFVGLNIERENTHTGKKDEKNGERIFRKNISWC